MAALALEGVPNTDIIVTEVADYRQFAIQVKTRLDIGSANYCLIESLEKIRIMFKEGLHVAFKIFGDIR